MEKDYGTLRVYLIVSTPSGREKLITLHRNPYIQFEEVQDEARSVIEANSFLPKDRIGITFTQVDHFNPNKL